MPAPANAALQVIRHGIDRVDDAMLLLWAARRLLVDAGSRIKRDAGLPGYDAARERQVHQRSRDLASRLRIPPEAASRLTALLIDDAHRQQGIARRVSDDPATPEAAADAPESQGRPDGCRPLARSVPQPTSLPLGDRDMKAAARSLLEHPPRHSLPWHLHMALHHGGQLVRDVRNAYRAPA
ncbi:hypothetical protein GCM10027084_16870 [Pseudoxanthomonas sangjuensis]|uniref:chorismate mutase n=1 Tax=Pseudoxanthomonas sangjuensis TaxID=1503750 RepID=UPI001390A438|nr:chorismate mutase [Pseudoxanthomonas sangjuensis]